MFANVIKEDLNKMHLKDSLKVMIDSKFLHYFVIDTKLPKSVFDALGKNPGPSQWMSQESMVDDLSGN